MSFPLYSLLDINTMLEHSYNLETQRLFTDVCNAIKGFLEPMQITLEDALRQSDIDGK